MNLSLADIANPQYSALTGKSRRTSIADVIYPQVPSAMQAAARRTEEQYEEDRLAEEKRQFEQEMALKQGLADQAAKQQEKADRINMASLGVQALYLGAKAAPSLAAVTAGTGSADTAAGVPISATENATTLAAATPGTEGAGGVESAPVSLASTARAGTTPWSQTVRTVAPAMVGAGVGYGVGRLTESRTKGAVAGGVVGALTGLAQGGPIGAVIGGILGVGGGIFGG